MYEGKNLPLPKEVAIEYLRELTSRVKPKGELILPETYEIKPENIPANLPDKEALAIIRFLRQRQILARYEAAKGHCPLSRHFCKNGGVVGGGVTKRARYIILSNHYEIDIVSCFHTIIVAFAANAANPILKPFNEARDFISGNLTGDGDKARAAKMLIQRIVTTPPQAIQHAIKEEHGLEIKAELMLHLHRYWNLQRKAIVDKMIAQGFVGCEEKAKINKNNMLYFPCEAAETKIMATAMSKILAETSLQSIVWLHDGMYINNEVPVEKAQKAFSEAAEECKIPNLQTKIVNCKEAINKETYLPIDPNNNSIAAEAARIAETITYENEEAIKNADKPLGRIKPTLRAKKRNQNSHFM